MKFLISNLRLLVRRFKSVAAINVVGLGVAFAVLLVVAMQVRYDLSYDRGFKNSGSIFRLETWDGEEWGWEEITNYQLPRLFRDRIPEVRDYCLREWSDDEAHFLREGTPADGPSHRATLTPVAGGFLAVFTPEIIEGDATGTLDTPGRALISQSTAAAIFGTESPVGQVLVQVEHPDSPITVDAVYRDFPAASSIPNGVFVHSPEQPSGNYNWMAYLLIDPADRDEALAKMNDSTLLADADDGRYTEQKYSISTASEYYLRGSVGPDSPGHGDMTLWLAIIGLVILAVAVINFVNLSMAMAPARVRNINVHRILGSGKGALRLSLAAEAVVMAAVAIAGGCLIVHWFGTSVFTDFFTANLSLADNTPLLVVCVAGMLSVAFCVGLYSARYSTSFDVAIALKSSFALSRGGSRLRNTLVVIQFATAVFFICFASFMWIQYRYMSRYNVGYERENILYVPAMADSTSRATFAREIATDPRVIDITVTGVPGNLGTQLGGTIDGKSTMFTIWPGEANTLRFFGVEIVAGEDFRPEGGRSQLIVNSEFVRRNGFTAEEIIGKQFRGVPIVGVAADVNFSSLHEQVGPMAFSANWRMGDEAFIKIAGDDVPGTLAFIERTWRSFPEQSRRSQWGDSQEWEFEFLDEKIDALYRRELNTSQLIGVLGMMAVAIAVMGVFGLIMFNTRYKTREIAIRKVNGATRGGVALMLNRNMLILVGVGFALAVPLTLVFITRWVGAFAYHAAVPWWLFPAGGLIVLAIAVATVSYQSWRAASANPVKALMSE